MKIEHRKIQVSRNSAFVYLPIAWAERQGLQKGDELEMTIENDRISVRPAATIRQDSRPVAN